MRRDCESDDFGILRAMAEHAVSQDDLGVRPPWGDPSDFDEAVPFLSRQDAVMGYRRDRGFPRAIKREERVDMIQAIIADYLDHNPADASHIERRACARMSLRVPRGLFGRATVCAAQGGTSLNTYVVAALADSVARDEMNAERHEQRNRLEGAVRPRSSGMM